MEKKFKKDKQKKAWQKPEIRTEKVFETAALACGKCTAGNPVYTGNCRVVPKLS